MLNNKTKSFGKEQKLKKTLKDWLLAIVITFVFCFMLFIYEPIFMYATNIDDFWFDFGIMIKPTMKIFMIFWLGSCLVSIVVYFISRMLKNNIWLYKSFIVFLSMLFIVAYIQGNWLIGSLPGLDGSEIAWDTLGKKEDIINSLIFVSLVIIGIILAVKFKLNNLLRSCTIISIIIFVMLFTSLIAVVWDNDALKTKNGINLTMNNFNSISENKNFLIFLVDSVDAKKFAEVLDSDPAYRDVFADFTFFTDTLSAFPFTQYSVPFILSGNITKNEKEFSEYSSEAYNNSKLFSMLEEKNYDLNLYSSSLVWNGKKDYDIKNAASINNANIDFGIYTEEELKWVSFKYLPYCMKQYSNIETMDFNKCIEKFWWFNPFVYQNIKDNSELQKIEEGVFHFIHADGGHIPFVYDKNCNWISEGTYFSQLESCITMISAYIQRLKDNGVYDNSVIIVMADHGYIERDTNLILTKDNPVILDRYNSLLLIKGINEEHELIESNKPVSHFDLIKAYADLLAGKKSTELFGDVVVPRTRKLIYYIWENDNHMVEYETDSTARDWQSFRETGNVYDRYE